MTEAEVIRKLYELSDNFKNHMRNRQYASACYCYKMALHVARFHGLQQKEMDKLFGVRGEKGVILQKGAFPEELVMEAQKQVYVLGNVKSRQ